MPENPPPTVSVTGTVRAPLDEVWKLFRPFGADVTKWWRNARSVELAAPGEDVVGAVRTYDSASGYVYEEKLVTADGDRHLLEYELVSSKPAIPAVSAITTSIQLQAAGEGVTTVHWTSRVTGGGPFLPKIKAVQEKVYRDAIGDLDAHFHPGVGTLRVSVDHAAGLAHHGLLPPDPYVVLELGGAKPVTTATRMFTDHPVFGEEHVLGVPEGGGHLHVGVWSARVGQPDPLGHAEIPLDSLKPGEASVHELELEGGEGARLTLTLALDLAEGRSLHDPAEVEQAAMVQHMMVAVDRLKQDAQALIMQLAQGEPGKYGYARYPRLPRLPDVALEELPKLTAGLPPSALLDPEVLGTMFTRQFQYLAAQRGILERMKEASDPFRVYFEAEVQVPGPILERTGEDEEFCRQLFQGACPHVVALVRDAAAIPEAFRGMDVDGTPLAELIPEKRLFLCDYSELLNVGDPEAIKEKGYFEYKGMVVYAPLVVIAKDGEGDDQRFRIVGIQLTRRDDPARNVVYTPGSATPNKYRAAKMHAACADMQYQEWIYHLGLAHLVVEPFAIAHKNAFPAEHVIGALLEPHFRDTIGINFLARQTLVSYTTPFTDSVFSTGSGGALKMVLGVWKDYDFQARTFPAMLAARGFDEEGSDGVAGYYFRDDAFACWNAIRDYVREVVEAEYASDAAVAEDPVLKAWAEESTDPERAGIPGFPGAFDSRDLLVETVTAIIHNSTVMHAAVNYTQMDYQAYLPNRSPSLVKPVPEGEGDVDEAHVQGTLPGQFVRHFQAMFSYILTMPGLHPLASFPPGSPKLAGPHERFQARLAEISGSIRARNAALEAAGKVPYPYLDPANVPASVAI